MAQPSRAPELIELLNARYNSFVTKFSFNDYPHMNRTTISRYLDQLGSLGYIERTKGVVGLPHTFTILKRIPNDTTLGGKSWAKKKKENSNGKVVEVTSKPSESVPNKVEDVATWIKDWIEYAKWLETKLAEEKRDHKDLRDWRDRICKSVPSPVKQRYVRY